MATELPPKCCDSYRKGDDDGGDVVDDNDDVDDGAENGIFELDNDGLLGH